MSSLSIQVDMGCEDCYDPEEDENPQFMKLDNIDNDVPMYVCPRCSHRITLDIFIDLKGGEEIGSIPLSDL